MISCFKGKFRVTSPRGSRTHPITGVKGTFHKGIDLVGVDDATVYSICDGTAKTAYQANGAGYYIVVTMGDGRRVFYMHLKANSFKVKDGERVTRGQALAVMGSTGASTGAHTHLELRPKGTTSDSIDICEFTKIPNKVGTYSSDEPFLDELVDNVKKKCGFDNNTIKFLLGHKWAYDLFLKLWNAMK